MDHPLDLPGPGAGLPLSEDRARAIHTLLRPAWQLLTLAAPAARLPVPPGAVPGARYLLLRRVAEIRDAELALLPFWNRRAYNELAAAACELDLSPATVAAVAEAATVMDAFASFADRDPPRTATLAGPLVPAPGPGLRSEAYALARLACVMAGQPNFGAAARQAARAHAPVPPVPAAAHLRRCTALAAGLALPRPWDTGKFLAMVAALGHNCPVTAGPLAGGGRHGAWTRTRHGDRILAGQAPTPWHRAHIITHAAAHILLGHQPPGGGKGPARRPGPVRAPALCRAGYATAAEYEAEFLASVIMARAAGDEEPMTIAGQLPGASS